ncbi:hypothetical protein OE749_01320 [Aestuariibacter sp. AA17]|uniref:SGNH/GDSL hydrolase family protein n=1 Tax=Fluctibacter corallii TaxID=2984329 RepID=A0ABT3A3S5_9ALTE|nr:hypothetical protein [Aestuariibacter sp. AA17]MCV2883335.1 hypothetical protein [Aestuariibacter sp. AA17]
MRYVNLLILGLISAVTLYGCGSGNSTDSSRSQQTSPTTPPSDNIASAEPIDKDVALLMIGNSHTTANGLPLMVGKLMKQALPDKRILVDYAPTIAFLYQHLDESTTLRKFESRQWTHVTLQAQRYSQSQSVDYPTDAAKAWVDKITEQGGMAVFFPEWRQWGRGWEGEYLHQLYSSIADQAPACVSPVGMAWDIASSIRPDLTLHAPDGNHANLTGSLLAALVITETISQYPADLLTPDETIDVSPDVQDFLGQVASQALKEYPACERLNN